MNAIDQKGRRDIVLLVVIGFFVGVVIPCIGIWTEFYTRLRWALSGSVIGMDGE